VAQVVERLLCKCEVLSSHQKKKKKRKRKEKNPHIHIIKHNLETILGTLI
jgi:hypothetical protein